MCGGGGSEREKSGDKNAISFLSYFIHSACFLCVMLGVFFCHLAKQYNHFFVYTTITSPTEASSD
jgi:hypothetical protein